MTAADRDDALGSVHMSVNAGRANVWFDRPRARNAMTWVMYEDMAGVCQEISTREDVRVAVFRGVGGKAFVAGTDIVQFAEFESGDDGIDYEDRIATFVAAVASLEVPTIAVVEGWAVGGGMAIASVCDFRVATPSARFGVPIARTLGNCLSVQNLAVLTAMLGTPMVKRMLLLAEMVPAEQLQSNGFVEAIAEPDALNACVDEYCERLAGHAPVTMAVTKQALSRLLAAADLVDGDLVRRAYGSQDFHEGVAAFVAKRAPQWIGK